jgi:lipopolysaccharide/colanic/teichoic acid biosynthesis glycosyltransferase
MHPHPISEPRRDHHRRQARVRLLSQALFHTVVIRERKRAERSERPIALVLVGPAAAGAWDGVVERLAAAKDPTDVMGWYEPGARLGIVRSVSYPRAAGRPGDGAGHRVGGTLGSQLTAEAADGLPVRVHVHPHLERPAGDELGPLDLALYPELTRRPRKARAADAAKRGLDLAASLALLVLLAPAVALIAALVKLSSPGPALFGQTRVGHMMRPFTMRKFRTMYMHAPPDVHREFVTRFITAGGTNGAAADGSFKLTNDRRVTPLGRILRRTSLDELPQLWNVLRGDMSLVGPRPSLPYEWAQYRPWHRRRVLEAKPGLTGLWQVTGRSQTTFDEMVRLDLRYARTCSLRNDIAILARTPAAVIAGRGAA